MPHKVTLKEISQRAGVSPATVSNVLNGRVGRVSAATAQLVLQAAAELGYRPTQPLPRAFTKRTGNIGVVSATLVSPLFSWALSGIVMVASRLGYGVVLCDNRGQEENDLASAKQLIERDVEGIIFLSSSSYRARNAFDCVLEANIPCVVVNRTIDPDKRLHLLVDNEQGTYDATVHLLELGHRDIACIHLPIAGPRATLAGNERLQGFRRALKDFEVEAREEWISPGVLGESTATTVGYQIAHAWLGASPRPSAIVCGTDLLAMGAMRAAFELGLKIPDDLAIVGHDDTSGAHYVSVPLTSVRQPMETIGARAAEALIQHLSTGVELTGVERYPCELIARESTVGNAQKVLPRGMS